MPIGLPEVLLGGVLLLVALLLIPWIALCWVVSNAVGRVARELQLISPAEVWLLLLPCWSLYWVFVVGQRVPRSLWAQLVGRQQLPDVGDCGETIGVLFGISVVLSAVPKIRWVGVLAEVILGTIFAVRVHQLSKRIDPAARTPSVGFEGRGAA